MKAPLRYDRIPAFRAVLVLLLIVSQVFVNGSDPHDEKHSRRSSENADSARENQKRSLSTKITKQSRAERFPSVEERVKLYMSNWYSPPCKDFDKGFAKYQYSPNPTTSSTKKRDEKEWPALKVLPMAYHPGINTSAVYTLQSIIEPDMVFFMEPSIVFGCANSTEPAFRVKMKLNMRMYCHDVADLLVTALEHLNWERKTAANDAKDSVTSVSSPPPPILLQFGDNRFSHVFGNVNVPHIKKFRSTVSNSNEIARVTSSSCESEPRKILQTVHDDPGKFQPIIWKLATHRHFEKLNIVYKVDTVWSQKKNKAVFRGQLTGSRFGYDKTKTDYENCHNLKRCRMVYDHAKSKYIDAKLTHTRNRLPDKIDDVQLVTPSVSLQDLLEYKGIIMIEGNDVASGLKWALLSQSVVLMPTPRHTSWAMEELLVPWVVRF
jgi:hypothetical protein